MPKPDTYGTCKDCAYFAPNADDDGQCRINPPETLRPDRRSMWPTVEAGDWCGSWEHPAVVAIEMEERIAFYYRDEVEVEE